MGELSKLKLPDENLNRIYRGVVEDNNDPLKAGRCRIRILGLHTATKISSAKEGVPTSYLLWAQPAAPIYGGVSKSGVFGVPYQGSHVFLFFENGNIMEPRYFATAPGIPSARPDTSVGFNDPAGIFPTQEYLNKPDWNEDPERVDLTYPFSYVISDKKKSKIIIDPTENDSKIIIQNGVSKSNIIIKEDETNITDYTKINIKAHEDDIKIEAISKNIEILATSGIITMNSTTYENIASSTAKLKGEALTEVGGGSITEVKANSIVRITGGIIQIG